VRGRTHHLADDRLFDCYVAERTGDRVDPPIVEHLADCAACGARYGEIAEFMDGLRNDADAEIDALFPPSLLERQRQQIAGRLEILGRAARVISFPAGLVPRHVSAAARFTPRWAAAAAAAGLFVGVAVGMFYDGRAQLSSARVAPAAVAPRQTQPIPVPAAVLDTDAFLAELEGALGGPRTPELRSLDVLTPHVREIGMFSQ
jgi:hypothetical protein